jgi:hypothetical protein
MTIDPNRRFAELAGICWHEREAPEYEHGIIRGYEFNCSCGYSYIKKSSFKSHLKRKYPDFSQAAEVLKVVMEPYPKFIELLFSIDEAEYYSYNLEKRRFIFNKFIDYITTPGKLRDAWIEWKEKT